MIAQEKFLFRPIPIDDPDLIKVDVALSLDEILAAQHCPCEEEFDGNDFAGATHLLARVRGEPARTLRLRWFADFVKVERVAVKREHRGESISSALMTTATDLARRKGYRKALGHIQAHLASFWERFGGRIRPNRAPFVFSDYEYVEFEFDLEPVADSLHLDTDPFILIRPEGRWNEPGVLDRSAARGGS
jgi:predicted GNAT family N-acyltransferase